VIAGFAAVATPTVTLPAGPLRLGDVAFELAVSTVDERGVDLGIDAIVCEIKGKLDVGPAKVDLGVGLLADPLADLPVEIRLELLAGILGEAGVLSEQMVVFLDQRWGSGADLIGLKVDGADGRDRPVGPDIEPPALAVTNPAVGGATDS